LIVRNKKVFALALLVLFTFSSTSAIAATKKPTPKATAKATPKATSKTTSKSTAKATTKATTKPKPKPRKRKPRKKIKVTPSPKPKWPPTGYSQNGEVFAHIPTKKELVGVISSKKNLASQIKECEKFVCGAVQVGAETGCTWWEVNSQVVGPERKAMGSLTTVAVASLAQEVKTILLITPELLETQGSVVGISVVCHHDAKPEGTADVTYKKVEN
jgi:hypothetical protein